MVETEKKEKRNEVSSHFKERVVEELKILENIPAQLLIRPSITV